MKKIKKYVCFLVLCVILAAPAGCSTANALPKASDPFSYSESLDENGFWLGIKASDYAELVNYKAFPIPSDIHLVTDEAIQAEVDYLIGEFPSYQQVTDRAVAMGDMANIDYVGSIDGVEFEGGNSNGVGMDVTIEPGRFIDDFLEQLVGHMPGETVNVEVTFPEDYGQDGSSAEQLRGKDALFLTTIHYISVPETITELTDEYVAKALMPVYGWTTAAEVLETIHNSLQNSSIQNYIYTYLRETAQVESVPERIANYQERALVASYQSVADEYGIELEELISSGEMGFVAANKEELIEQNKEELVKNGRYCLILQTIAEDGGFAVSDEDMVQFFETNYGSSDYSMYEERFGLPYLKQFIMYQNIIDYINENKVLM